MHSEKKNKLSETIRERLKNYERPIVNDVWIRIERDLAALKHRQIRRRIIATVAAAIVAIMICIPLLLRDERAKIAKRTNKAVENQNFTADFPKIITDSPKVISNNQKTVVGDKTKIINNIDGVLPTTSKIRKPVKKQKPVDYINAPKNVDANAEQNKVAQEINSLVAKTEIKDNQDTKQNEEQKDTSSEKATIKDESKQNEEQSDDKTDMRDKKTQKKKKRFDFALAMGNSPVSNGRENKSDVVMMNEVANSHLEKITVSSHNFDSDHADTRFGPPISAGLLIRKHLSERWALESGLVYTCLFSSETSNNIERKTRLHYLGVPLGTVYTLLEMNRFSVYATAGGMGEI
ncbi:MAG: PorT family protein, partial [Prevotellaceae bacterium]|nr:PorT family protein [Prevotellaceae bacterium]